MAVDMNSRIPSCQIMADDSLLKQKLWIEEHSNETKRIIENLMAKKMSAGETSSFCRGRSQERKQNFATTFLESPDPGPPDGSNFQNRELEHHLPRKMETRLTRNPTKRSRSSRTRIKKSQGEHKNGDGSALCKNQSGDSSTWHHVENKEEVEASETEVANHRSRHEESLFLKSGPQISGLLESARAKNVRESGASENWERNGEQENTPLNDGWYVRKSRTNEVGTTDMLKSSSSDGAKHVSPNESMTSGFRFEGESMSVAERLRRVTQIRAVDGSVDGFMDNKKESIRQLPTQLSSTNSDFFPMDGPPLFKVIDYRNNKVGESYGPAKWRRGRSTRNAKSQASEKRAGTFKTKLQPKTPAETAIPTGSSSPESTALDERARVWLTPQAPPEIPKRRFDKQEGVRNTTHGKRMTFEERDEQDHRIRQAERRLFQEPMERHFVSESIAEKIANLFRSFSDIDFASLSRKISHGIENALKSDNFFKRNREMHKRNELKAVKVGWSFSRQPRGIVQSVPHDSRCGRNIPRTWNASARIQGSVNPSNPYLSNMEIPQSYAGGPENFYRMTHGRGTRSENNKTNNKILADQVLARMKSGSPVVVPPTNYFKEQYEECLYKKNLLEIQTNLQGHLHADNDYDNFSSQIYTEGAAGASSEIDMEKLMEISKKTRILLASTDNEGNNSHSRPVSQHTYFYNERIRPTTNHSKGYISRSPHYLKIFDQNMRSN